MSDLLGVLSPLQSARRATLKVAGLGFLLLFAFAAGWPAHPYAHHAIEMVGYLAIAACIVGRCWCTLYIGGRKISTLVRVGPYSVCRNPLYFFSFIGAAGVGAQTGSLTITALLTFVTWAVFRFVVSKEEAFLKGVHGEAYERYLRTTPRFLPNPTLWRGVETLEVLPGRVMRTFIDGLPFLLAIPLAEGLEQMQNVGWLPILLRLP